MTSNLRFIIIAIMLFGLSLPQMRAKDNHDLASWMLAKAVWKKDKWAISGGLEYRMNQHISRPNLYSFSVFGKYKYSQLLRLSMGYEFFGCDDGNQHITVDHRMMCQAELLFKIHNFKFANRTSLLNSFTNLGNPNWGVRDRLMLSYPISRFVPYLYGEIYYMFDDSSMKHQKDRYAGGVTYLLNGENTVGVYYMAEHFAKTAFTNHIIGLTYTYTLN